VVTGYDFGTGQAVGRGTFWVEGDVIVFVWTRSPLPFTKLGVPTTLRWGIFRDKLTISTVPGRESEEVLALRPWIRVR
jgi:hypothetical protein